MLVGFGSVNRAVLELALDRPWLEVVGIVVRSEERAGEAANVSVPGAPQDLRCATDLAATLAATRPDVAIIATRTELAEILEPVERAAGAKCTVLCTSEELAFVPAHDSPVAERLHDLARRCGVAVVATGVNPGFVLDLWPLVLSGLAWDVRQLSAHRVVDVSVFGERVRRALGIDVTPEAFRAGIADGSIVGHAGFRESLRIIASAMGRQLDAIDIASRPIVAAADIKLPDGTTIMRGRTAGVSQSATGWVAANRWLEMALTLHVAPAAAGLEAVDEITLHGRHTLHVRVEPGCGAILSTAALLVNGIPRAMAASPGLHRPGDLAPVTPWLGDEAPPWVPLRN